MKKLRGQALIEGVLRPAEIQLEAGDIAAVGEAELDASEERRLITPGLIDLHVHGYGGADPLEDLPRMARALARSGTTAFQPTLFPAAPGELGRQAEGLSAAAGELPTGCARVLGLHLEGPFVNPEAAGALPREDLAQPSVSALREILGPNSGDGRGIRTVTLAPELAGSRALIEELVRADVRVSLGHSLANRDQARAGLEAGASGVTHLFNAMGPFHHRDVGLPGVAMLEGTLTVEIIADLKHVSPAAFDLALRARGPEGLCIVSDALLGAGTGCDVFHWHGREHIVRGKTAYYPREDREPQLAGCASSQLDMLRGLVEAGIVNVADALTMASTTPARSLGHEAELGCIRPGARADLLVLEADSLELIEVYVGGEALQPG